MLNINKIEAKSCGVVKMSGTKAMKMNILDEFEIKGFWKLPESKEEVSGILFYSKDKITLELLGSLGDEYDIPNKLNRYDIIHGFSDKGEEFTLFDVYMSTFSFNAPGILTESYFVNEFIVGGNFKNKEEIELHSMSIYPTYLTEWLDRRNFIRKYDENRNLKTIEWIDSVAFEYIIEVLDININEINYIGESINNQHNFNWTTQAGLQIIPKEMKNLEWFLDISHSLKNLLTLIINQPIYIIRYNFYGDIDTTIEGNEKYRKKYCYFRTVKNLAIKSKFDESNAFVKFRDIEESFELIINNWFKVQTEYETIFDLYTSEFYKTKYINSSFLSAVQSLETYHRKKFNTKLFDEEVYKGFASKIIEYAKKDTPEIAAKIEGMLGYGNEVSLSRRIKEILGSMGEDVTEYIIGEKPKQKKFTQQLVDTRNYLTHFDKRKKANLLESFDELFYATQRLKAIQTVILYRELGIEESWVFDKIKHTNQFSWHLPKAKKILN